MCVVDNVEICDEEEFRGGRLVLFILFYVVAVLLIVVLFELIMPVFDNPDYPFYNHVPDFTYVPPNN
ncbi:Protein W01D2.6 [Aphelenchoides avenae]|nr:Protein W01D2.6 [Aphelenchus avenae]